MTHSQTHLDPPTFKRISVFYSINPSLSELEDIDKNIFQHCQWIQKLSESDDYV
jgi:hypothetical protein